MTNERYAQFLQQFPEFAETLLIDELRAKEFSRLDRNHQVYLDYTGGGLYSESQIRSHQQLLLENVFGNPHSSNPTSSVSTMWVEKTRQAILKFFNASPEEYVVIFTQNASGALKLVGESYPFGEDCCYLLTYDNHNSVNGIREYAQAKGATVRYLPVFPPEMRIGEEKLEEYLKLGRDGCHNLFAYPHSRIFPRCCIRWNGSERRKQRDGTCCWMWQPLLQPTVWTFLCGSLILSLSLSIKCLDTPQASEH